MDWFKPDATTITDFSTACFEAVFLVYLLTLKRKSEDCWLMIGIYLTAVIFQTVGVIVSATVNPSFTAILIDRASTVITLLSVIWCSYRFHRNTFPKESIVVMLLFTCLFCLNEFNWMRDIKRYYQVSLPHIVNSLSLCGLATLWSGVNYVRKIRIVADGPAWKELLRPSGKVTAVFRGFALSLLLYTIIWIVDILIFFAVINPFLNALLVFVLAVWLTIIVTFSYFNYAAEQTSFETKLVGITLVATLGVIGLLPMAITVFSGQVMSIGALRVFFWLIPLVTLLISLFLPLLFRLTILKHLRKIVAGVQQVTSGDITARINIDINDEIGYLSENFNAMTGSLRQRSEQLESMRETIATDFHDQTGNMLSAITRQASLLKMQLSGDHVSRPMVDSIINNSNQLYASTKDFLWHLNHHSDEPNDLFNYLTAYGQQYYNQFDIAFSAAGEIAGRLQLPPSAALNIIFIFKEAMNNVVKHSGASEVELKMWGTPGNAVYWLSDNGTWKPADRNGAHYGLNNMEKRSAKNGFGLVIHKQPGGTALEVTVPLLNSSSHQ